MDIKSHPGNLEEISSNTLEKNSSVARTRERSEISNKRKSEHDDNNANKFDLPSFKCTECPYQSIWKHAVKRHQRIHARHETCQGSSSKMNKLQCNHCSYSVDNWEEFKNHQTLHEKSFEVHKKILDLQNESGLFHCDQCDYVSNKKRVFLKHIRMLHKGRPWTDEEDVTYREADGKVPANSQTSLKRAYRRGKYADVPVKMTKNGLFECEHCSYQTAIRTALVKHQTNHLKS